MPPTGATPPVVSPADFGKGPSGEAARWISEIDLYESQQKPAWNRYDKIVKRYRNESWRDDMPSQTGADVSGRGFAMFWANVETLKPTIYAQPPKADVQRRWKDKDPVARCASEILERCLDYFIDQECFEETITACRNDYLIIGQGVPWNRYVPHFHDVELRIPVQRPGMNSGPGVADMGVEITNNAEEYDSEDADDSQDTGDQEDGNSGAYQTMDGDPVDKDAEVQTDAEGAYFNRTQQEIASEEWALDYVYWRDFGWTPGARTWAEVYCVWRKAYLTRDELCDRFTDKIGEKVRLTYDPGKNSETGQDGVGGKGTFKKGEVYEIWDSTTRKVTWVSKGYDGDYLDKRDYPIKLSGRFPCGKPVFATQTNGQITAVPDYLQYQDQADEMDTLTQKIYVLMEAIKVRFLYAGNMEELKDLLQNSSDNDGTPVDSSLLALYNGDINKAVWFFPLDMMVKALNELIAARERVKADAYEVTGISDIIRGATDASETATAQQLKAQSSSIRVKDKQKNFAGFVCAQLRIGADIITNHFQPESIADICDLKTVPEAMHVMGPNGEWTDPAELARMMAQGAPGPTPDPLGQSQPPMAAGPTPQGQAGPAAAPLPGVPAGIPIPQPNPMTAGMGHNGGPAGPMPGMPFDPSKTLGHAAIALLKDPMQRAFRIDIETDSTIAMDEAGEKAARTEFVTAIGGFLEAAVQIAATPMGAELGPLLGEILLFAVRGFKVGTQLEGAIESAIEQLQAKAKNPPPPPPNPEMIKAQAQAQAIQASSRNDQMKTQGELAIQQAEATREDQTHQQVIAHEAIAQQGEMAVNAQRAQTDAVAGRMDLVGKGVDLAGKHVDLQIAQARLKEAMQPKPNGAGSER